MSTSGLYCDCDFSFYNGIANKITVTMSVISGSVFSIVDYIVLGGMVLISVIIGLFFAYRDKDDHSTNNYFLGSQKLKAIPVAFSFVVTFQSSILIIGFPAEAYAYGMQYIMQGIGITAAYLIAAVIVVPIFHPLKVTTVYQYYSIRFGNNYVRILALVCGAIHYTFYMGIVMYGTGLALESAAGIPGWVSVISLSLAAIVYTSIGGFKSVIWTDVFQAMVMLVGILAVLIKTSIKAGDIGHALKISNSRLNFFDFNPDPTVRHTFWTLVIGSFSQFLYLTVSQASIQRINSTPSIKTAKRLFYIAGPVFTGIFFLVMIQGLTIFAYYANKGCDPLASGQIKNVNMIIPFTIVELFKDIPGLPGLFLAALSAASLSSISSGLSCLAAMTHTDCIKLVSKNMSERKGTNISKIIVVVYGIVSIGFAFLLSNIVGPLGQIMSSMMGAISGPEIGLYLCCIFFHKTTSKGAGIGLIAGIVFTLWLSIGQNFLAAVPKTPYLPLGPTDKCYNSTLSINSNESMFDNYSDVLISDGKYAGPIFFDKTTMMVNVSPSYDLGMSSADNSASRSVLKTLYSISYMYFNLIGCITVIIVSIIVSLLTQPADPVEVNKTTILPLTALVPHCCQSLFKNKRKSQEASGEKEVEVELLSKA